MYIQKYNISAIWKTTLLCLSLSFFSCANNPINPSDPDSGVSVKVELNFRIPKFDNPQEAKSRAATNPHSDKTFHVELVSDVPQSTSGEVQPTTRAADAPLYNLWVLQFSSDGKVVKVVQVSTDDTPVYENQTIDVDLKTGSDQTIYLIALGKRYGHVNLSNVKSIDELEATSFDFVRYEDGFPTAMITSEEDVPYSGSCSKLSIIQLEEDGKGYVDYNNSDGFGGAINMKALVSLVTIDFTYQVENMTPYSISLNNVPTTFAVNSKAYMPSQFVNLPTTLLKPTDLAGGKRITMSWYTAPNPQGIVPSIRSEVDRYFYYKTNSTTSVGTAPRDGTYIHVWASKDATPNDYALYYLFLGSNTTDDFNIHPHSHYRYRTDINTADDLNDKRIVYKKLEQTVDFSVSASATPDFPTFPRRGSRFDFDSHPDMRPIELTALRGTVSVEILPGSDNGVITTWPKEDVPPINASNSWLKISVYPNYTAALDAHQKGDPNALATSIKLNASIPGLFRLYLYSNEYEKYVTDNVNDNKNKRSLFVRFTFQTETDKKKVYTTRMDQRAGFYIGEFGGTPTMINGEFRYPKGLVVESVEEYRNIQYLNYMPASFPMYPAYSAVSSQAIPSDNDMRRYGAYETYNGRSATIMMAENKYRISPIIPNYDRFPKVQSPRYVNGHVDIYQYKYHTNDGFAQRWCYDKNRDNNGNGYLDDNEIVWYMPSIWQTYSIPLNCYTTSTDYLRINGTSGFNANYIASTTMYSTSSRMNFGIYDLGLYNSNYSSNVLLKCVRDIEPIVGLPQGVKYYEQDGYPVIDATGLMAGASENRVDNPNVVILPGDGDDPSYTGRVIRHYSPSSPSNAEVIHEISRRVSRRFRVSPSDVGVNGNAVPEGSIERITWAEASGYAIEANGTAITSDKTPVAQTGCAAYTGIDGKDPVGKWRLPTIREVFLICMMDPAMKNDNAITKYIPLYYFGSISPGGPARYWTAEEKPDATNQVNYAYVASASGRVTTVGGVNNPAGWTLNAHDKANKDVYIMLARCIYDLP